MTFTMTYTAHATETKTPLLAEVVDPTCFTARRVTTQSGVWMVVTALSSMFHILYVIHQSYTSVTSPRFLKSPTFVQFKRVSHAKVVASALLIDRS